MADNVFGVAEVAVHRERNQLFYNQSSINSRPFWLGCGWVGWLRQPGVSRRAARGGVGACHGWHALGSLFSLTSASLNKTRCHLPVAG